MLAIETSTNACSVALGIGDEVIGEHVVEPRAHTRILMPMIHGLLSKAGIGATDLDVVALGNGPGSFIGMRIGAAVAQGICFAAGIDVVPVSSMAAVAAEAFDVSDAAEVVVTQDARMNEVYTGIYVRDASGLPRVTEDEFIGQVGALLLPETLFFAAGGGWRRYPELIQSGTGTIVEVLDIDVPNAVYVLQLAQSAEAVAIPPASLTPAYLRQKVAEKPAGTG